MIIKLHFVERFVVWIECFLVETIYVDVEILFDGIVLEQFNLTSSCFPTSHALFDLYHENFGKFLFYLWDFFNFFRRNLSVFLEVAVTRRSC